MDFTKFRQNLKIVRASKGLTAKELSKKCDLRQMKRVADIEEGRGKPTLVEVVSICTELNVTIDNMLSGTVIIKYSWK